jgi:abortive infection bacteriophage resistance protein
VANFSECFSADEHLLLLKQRGLTFKNDYEEERFVRLLDTIGYYKLSQYFKHFYTGSCTKQFTEGTTGKHIITAYKQNERLRSVLIDALLKLECKLRTLLTEAMIASTQTHYWCYGSEFKALKLVEAATRRNSKGLYHAQSTQLFNTQYPSHTQLPAWVIMQAQDFGTLCQLLKHKHCEPKVRKRIAKSLALPFPHKYTALYNIFDALRYLRNKCVHHEKLLGEGLRVAPPLWVGVPSERTHYLDNALFWVEHLLKSVTVRASFSQQLGAIVDTVNSQCPEALHLVAYSPTVEEPEEED